MEGDIAQTFCNTYLTTIKKVLLPRYIRSIALAEEALCLAGFVCGQILLFDMKLP